LRRHGGFSKGEPSKVYHPRLPSAMRRGLPGHFRSVISYDGA
jgi:hypothetical protein